MRRVPWLKSSLMGFTNHWRQNATPNCNEWTTHKIGKPKFWFTIFWPKQPWEKSNLWVTQRTIPSKYFPFTTVDPTYHGPRVPCGLLLPLYLLGSWGLFDSNQCKAVQTDRNPWVLWEKHNGEFLWHDAAGCSSIEPWRARVEEDTDCECQWGED